MQASGSEVTEHVKGLELTIVEFKTQIQKNKKTYSKTHAADKETIGSLEQTVTELQLLLEHSRIKDEEVVQSIDANGDGEITGSEVEASVKELQNKSVPPAHCSIYHGLRASCPLFTCHPPAVCSIVLYSFPSLYPLPTAVYFLTTALCFLETAVCQVD